MARGDRLSERSAPGPGIPAFLGRPGPTPFHRLNPLTKATLATVTAGAGVQPDRLAQQGGHIAVA